MARQRNVTEGKEGREGSGSVGRREIVPLLDTRPPDRPTARPPACPSPLSAATDRNVNSVFGRTEDA